MIFASRCWLRRAFIRAISPLVWGRAWLPDSLARSFPPLPPIRGGSGYFRAPPRWRDREGKEGRHHIHETNVQRAVPKAVRASGIDQRVTCHTFRHSFATHLWSECTTSEPSRACPERSRRELLGHRDVSTTMICTHVLRHGTRGVKSPLRRISARVTAKLPQILRIGVGGIAV
jgi:integrase